MDPPSELTTIKLEPQIEKIVDAGHNLDEQLKLEQAELSKKPLPNLWKKQNKKQKMMDSKGKSVAVKLLMSANKTNYGKIRDEFIESFKLDNHDLPTYYYMTLHRPKFVKGIYTIDPQFSFFRSRIKNKKVKEKRCL